MPSIPFPAQNMNVTMRLLGCTHVIGFISRHISARSEDNINELLPVLQAAAVRCAVEWYVHSHVDFSIGLTHSILRILEPPSLRKAAPVTDCGGEERGSEGGDDRIACAVVTAQQRWCSGIGAAAGIIIIIVYCPIASQIPSGLFKK